MTKLHNATPQLTTWYYLVMSITKQKTTKPKRAYRRITAKTVAEQKALETMLGNASAAVRALTPTVLNPGDRAWHIRKKSEEQNSVDFIDDTMQQIGVDAINRVGKLVNSSDEKVATRNAHYIIDHLRGQAVRRSESKHVALTIEAVLE